MMKKNKSKLVAALLAFVITFSNTGNFKTGKYYINDNNHLEVDANDKLKELGKKYYEFYDKYLVKYSNPEYLKTNLDVYQYRKKASNTKNCNYKYNGTIINLINTIRSNTAEYLKTKSKTKYLNAVDLDRNFKGSIKQENYGAVVSAIYTAVQSEITRLMNNQLLGNNNEDLCKMKDLKVLLDLNTNKYNKDGSITLGQYLKNDNVIIIYLDSFLYKQARNGKTIKADINKRKIIDIKVSNNLKKVVFHEINHMRQSACKDRNNNSDITYMNTGLSLIEATAESALYDENSSLLLPKSEIRKKDRVYLAERSFVNDLLLMTVTDNTTTIDDFYASVFNSDSQAFIDYFNLKSNHDIRSFLNILSRYDAKMLRNNVAYDIGEVKKDSKDCYFKAATVVGNDYKIDLLRLSLRNLIDYNIKNNSELELEEIVLLEKIMLYQACNQSNSCKLDSNGNLLKQNDGTLITTYDKNFVSQLLELENKFNGYIMQNYNINELDLAAVSNKVDPYVKYLCLTADNTSMSKKFKFDDNLVRNLVNKFPKLKVLAPRVNDFLGLHYKYIKKIYKK